VIEVEGLRGAKSAANSFNATIQLVEAKLEMVRAGWLFEYVSAVRRLYRFNRFDRVQRDEIY